MLAENEWGLVRSPVEEIIEVYFEKSVKRIQKVDM